jgi:enamine deaminase RidA (YjgF/YER057c/UK114 family)
MDTVGKPGTPKTSLGPQTPHMRRAKPLPHHGRLPGGHASDGDAVVLSTSFATEVFVRCGSSPSARNSRCWRQAQESYECLTHLLAQAGATLAHVVAEKIFFRDIAADIVDFQDVRSDHYQDAGVGGNRLPATTYLEQPPCRPGQALEIQAYAVVPNSPALAAVEAVSPAAEHGTAKVVRIGDCRHLYVANLIGKSSTGQLPKSFRDQCDAMFAQANHLVQSHTASFADVLRTWLYLDDMDGDYGELNASRNRFFAEHAVRRLPASTGIGGGPHPRGARCAMDLYTLLNPQGAKIEVMHTPTLNEAAEYGSSFSRGMKVVLPEKTLLFISGTASVDEAGATVHVDDVAAQIDRMLVNIAELLRPHGATFGDVAQAITYLKSPEYLDAFRQTAAQRGLGEAPNTLVKADVCRPDLLCEMEAIAVLPGERA